jgi:hypothetical protein
MSDSMAGLADFLNFGKGGALVGSQTTINNA